MSKKCKSCGGPVKDYPSKKVVNPNYCPYCCDKKGELKSYRDIIDMMIDYLEDEHDEIRAKDRANTARKWLRKNPAWKEKYVGEDVVIENIRENNFKDIPAMSDKHDCQKCMYYQSEKGTKKNKKNWFMKMRKKYGNVGKVLYFKGEPVGFSQFAPKKEFKKLEELKKGSTKTDAWYISCIAIKNEFRGNGLGNILLKSVIDDLKKRNIRKIHACGKVKGDASHFSSGYWSMYKKLGFYQIGGDEDYIVGEKKL